MLSELITPVVPPKKLPTSLYAASGAFPIIDQSEDFVCGWTDDFQAVIDRDTPLVVFGDHTCALKFVDFPFAQGADGIKVLSTKSRVSIEYLYQSLLHKPLKMVDYRRHFSILKNRVVNFPDTESGEQQRIADCLFSLDAVIAAEGERLAALTDHKKGLMQGLFPAEGQTTPRLRFPEFQRAGEWEEKALSCCIELVSGLHLAPNEYAEAGEIPYFSGPSDFTDVRSEVSKWTSKAGNVAVEGDMLLVVKGSGVGDFCRLAISRVAIGRQLMAIRTTTGDQNFLLYLIATKAGLLKARATGNLIPGLARPDILDLRALFPPEVSEQKQIAQALSSLDSQIATLKTKLVSLKAHKSGLMQQLFPSPAEAAA